LQAASVYAPAKLALVALGQAVFGDIEADWSLQNFTLRTAAQKNCEIKDGIFKTKTQKRAMCEKDKIGS